MFAVLCYVVLFTIFLDKGYQIQDSVTGSTSAKLKGSASIGDPNLVPFNQLIPVDAMDLVQPSMEENAFFIASAQTITPNQTLQLNCPGNDAVPTCNNTDTSQCNEAVYSWKSQGLFTGNCGNNGRCEMYSWCPLENDTNPQIIHGVGTFTAFVKVEINFQLFDVSRTNFYQRPEGNYAPVAGYNLFTINEMLEAATDGDIMNVSQIADHGAIILVRSVWNCDLDKSEDECNPEWEFKRVDSEDGMISSGCNFRMVTYDTSGEKRFLRKYYGLRFVFVTEGVAGKFDFAAMTVTFGAGLAYLGIAALIADIVLERFLPQSHLYNEEKNKNLDGYVETNKVIPNTRINEE